MWEQDGDVAAAVEDLHNSDAGVGETVEDEMLSDRKTVKAGTQIFTAAPSIRILSEGAKWWVKRSTKRSAAGSLFSAM